MTELNRRNMEVFFLFFILVLTHEEMSRYGVPRTVNAFSPRSVYCSARLSEGGKFEYNSLRCRAIIQTTLYTRGCARKIVII